MSPTRPVQSDHDAHDSDALQEPEVLQEYVDNRATDVEPEDPDDGVVHDPWNPDEIRIHSKTFSLRQIVDMIDDEELDLAPDFQRQYVWKDPQRWGLIESLLLGIPLPSFYFNEDREGLLQVVDGVQRLTTIHRFYKGKFALGPLAYLKDLEGQRFEDLNGRLQRRLKNTQFMAHVIDPQTPQRVKFDVFKRINTGGSPLSAQEIRHCMSRDRSRRFLKEMVELPAFRQVMGDSVLDHPRMADREIALRLVAFHIAPVEDYRKHGSLDAFLWDVTTRIDEEPDEDKLEELKALAVRALLNAKTVFGDHAFRKWPLGSERKNPISRTLVESWGTELARWEPTEIGPKASKLQRVAREMMTRDETYLGSISGGTGDPNKLEARMSLVERAVRRVMGREPTAVSGGTARGAAGEVGS